MPRSITDTATELEQRVSDLTHIMENRDWSSSFIRHKLKEAFIRAQEDAVHRLQVITAEGMIRDWAEAEPKPAREAVRAIVAS